MEITKWKDKAETEVAEFFKQQEQGLSACPVEAMRSFSLVAQRNSCGECVLCREGSLQLYMLAKDISEGNGKPEDIDLMRELIDNIKQGCSCNYGTEYGAAAERIFQPNEEVFEKHIKRKRCDELECKALYTCHVLPDKCTGCTDCIPVCPVDAIAGGSGLIHVIDNEKCNRCGECIKICPASAVEKAGAIQPKTPEQPVPVGSFAGAAAGGGLGRKRKKKA